ncbi:hypothetical protein [Colwellia hornerae]|uniref:Uncharacterized protein n=1 Tax=Colwellia hornerae TaxID=89402 RepID=A0A5C6Q585_9GAMM|nr:hypothetical protein [Colwellia hornerae]TWX48070.1 hypothetical protein ESZ28_17155 [Colwellia hornerae]TWX54889.1 hypothetical protein ESZ26_17125 [Colwellia hornerae]TWX63747.1 hypothetical protein ESZ27_15920 [Colwellia hornerae]
MSEQYNRTLLAGRWYRMEMNDIGQQLVEYAELCLDGSFEFSFVEQTSQGEIISQVIELGDWGLVGDIHFTITQEEVVDGDHYRADLNDENNYQAYKVLALDSQIFKYQHIVSNEVFILRRVVDKIGHC